MRALLCAVVLIVPALSGCLHDLGIEADFGSVVLAVRLLGSPNESWQNESFRMSLHETIRAPKAEPGPQGGGGTPFNLTRRVNFTLEARLEDAERLADAKARWLVYDDQFRILIDTENPGNQAIALDIVKPGRLKVGVALGKGLRVDEVTRTLEVIIDQRWTVESAVQPVGTATMATAATMQDRFDLEIPDRRANLSASTTFRGTWPGPHGTNVDLTVQRDRTAFACRGTGGAGRPGPEQATENLPSNMVGANFAPVLYVGSQPTGCPGAGTPTGAPYTNAFLVPYRLDVNVTYVSYEGKPPRQL